MKMKVVGVDPSLRNFGLCAGTIDLSHEDFPFELEELKLVESESDKASKKVVRKNSDDLRRATKLQRTMTEFINKHEAQMVIVEVPVGSQSARSMASYGICIGVLASIRKPMIQVTPTEVKLSTVGSKTASKDAMIKWATQAYPDAAWLTRKVKGEVTFVAKNEHLADSVAAVHAGILTEPFIQAVGILGMAA